MSRNLTTVNEHATGMKYQFHFGGDRWCEPLQVGDAVEPAINPDRPLEGAFLDGAYCECYYENDGDDCAAASWCVIAGGKVAAIAPSYKYAHPGDEFDFAAYRAHLELKHGCVPPSFDSWSIEAWARQAIAKAAYSRRSARRSAANIGKSREKLSRMAVDALSAYTRRRMQEPGFLRQMFRTIVAEACPTRRQVAAREVVRAAAAAKIAGLDFRKYSYTLTRDSGVSSWSGRYNRPAIMSRCVGFAFEDGLRQDAGPVLKAYVSEYDGELDSYSHEVTLPVPADGDYSRQLRDFIELWSEDAPPHEVKSDD